MKITCPIDHAAIVVYNKGTAALQQGKYEKAVTLLKKSIRMGETIDAWLNLGTAYKFLDMDTLAIDAFIRATSLDTYCMETCFSIPGMALNNLGLMSYLRGDDILAEKYYLEALDLWKNSPTNKNKEEFYDCKWNLSTCVLRQVCSGDFSRWNEGWELYESRFKKSRAVCVHPVFGPIAHKIWLGQKDCRVVVAQEQGIGDNIMLCRFIPEIERLYGIKCDFQVNESLGALLALNGISCPKNIDVRDYDYVLPLGSICRFVGEIDREAYITAPSTRDFNLHAITVGLPVSAPNIGVVWSGSSSHTNDRHRSCPSAYFKKLTRFGNLWNLNPGCTNLPKWVNTLRLPTWSDTAANILGLDFVVCVDTSVAHMCGALGVPCYLLQPCKETDFRWGDASTSAVEYEQNIWYASVTVIKNPNSWEECFKNLEKAILS